MTRMRWAGSGLALMGDGYTEKVETGAYINGEKQDIAEFAANQPYEVMIRYWVPAAYVLTPTFQSVTVVVNGLPVTFEDVTAFP